MVQAQDDAAAFAEEPWQRSPVEPAPIPRRMDYRIVLNNGNEVSLRDAECEYDPVIGHLVFRMGDSGSVYRFYWPHVAFYVSRRRR